MLLLEQAATVADCSECEVFLLADPAHHIAASMLAEQLRDALPQLRLKLGAAAGLKSQMKKADQSGATLALILAADEVQQHSVTVKFLATGEQTIWSQQGLAAQLADYLQNTTA